jgi:hypothetical protein
MLVIGGRNPGLGDGWPDAKDTWQKGMYIFDMTALSWTLNYDASAPSYEAPSVIKQHYTDGYVLTLSCVEIEDANCISHSGSKVDWSSPAVSALFGMLCSLPQDASIRPLY